MGMLYYRGDNDQYCALHPQSARERTGKGLDDLRDLDAVGIEEARRQMEQDVLRPRLQEQNTRLGLNDEASVGKKSETEKAGNIKKLEKYMPLPLPAAYEVHSFLWPPPPRRARNKRGHRP